MRARLAVTVSMFALVAASCSDSGASQTTVTTVAPTTTTTTLIPTTSSTLPASTTSEANTTTTTTVAETTTTTEAPDETSTTTTTRVSATTTSTTTPPVDADPDLIDWAGLFRQPTSHDGFLDFQATGVILAGTSIDNLDTAGRWDYDDDADEFTFWDFDFGAGCGGAEGRYLRETAFGGGRRISLIEDPCEDRVNFLTQPGSTCQCYLYNRVERVEDDG